MGQGTVDNVQPSRFVVNHTCAQRYCKNERYKFRL